MITDELLAQTEEVLGYRFQNHQLLKEALTHASIADNRRDSNERLEFLGDAVLGLAVVHRLFELFPNMMEGDMTKLKSAVVSRQTCAAVANDTGLTDLVFVGKGMLARNEQSQSMAAGALEAIIGAIYLDGGFEAAAEYVLDIMDPWIQQFAATSHQDNYKSMLQQHAQRHLGASPQYRILDEKGPDHSKCFEIAVVVGSRTFSSVWAPSKKQAEQRAAQIALEELGALPRSEPIPFEEPVHPPEEDPLEHLAEIGKRRKKPAKKKEAPAG